MIDGTNPARNVHTGDLLVSKHTTNAYRDGWEAIFGKKKGVVVEAEVEATQEEDEAFKEIENKQLPSNSFAK